MTAARDWGRGQGMQSCFNRYRVSHLLGKKVLKTYCTTMWIYSTLLNYTLKNNGQFCLLTTIFKVFDDIKEEIIGKRSQWKMNSLQTNFCLVHFQNVERFLTTFLFWDVHCQSAYLKCSYKRLQKGPCKLWISVSTSLGYPGKGPSKEILLYELSKLLLSSWKVPIHHSFNFFL